MPIRVPKGTRIQGGQRTADTAGTKEVKILGPTDKKTTKTGGGATSTTRNTDNSPRLTDTKQVQASTPHDDEMVDDEGWAIGGGGATSTTEKNDNSPRGTENKQVQASTSHDDEMVDQEGRSIGDRNKRRSRSVSPTTKTHSRIQHQQDIRSALGGKINFLHPDASHRAAKFHGKGSPTRKAKDANLKKSDKEEEDSIEDLVNSCNLSVLGEGGESTDGSNSSNSQGVDGDPIEGVLRRTTFYLAGSFPKDLDDISDTVIANGGIIKKKLDTNTQIIITGENLSKEDVEMQQRLKTKWIPLSELQALINGKLSLGSILVTPSKVSWSESSDKHPLSYIYPCTHSSTKSSLSYPASFQTRVPRPPAKSGNSPSTPTLSTAEQSSRVSDVVARKRNTVVFKHTTIISLRVKFPQGEAPADAVPSAIGNLLTAFQGSDATTMKYKRSASVSPSASKPTTSSSSDSPSGSGSQISASPPASPCSLKPAVGKHTDTKVMEKEVPLSESGGIPKKVSFAKKISVRVYFPSTQRSTTTRPIPPSPFPRIVPLSQMKYTRSASVSPSASKPTTSSSSDSPSGSGSQISASPPASPCSLKPAVGKHTDTKVMEKEVPLSESGGIPKKVSFAKKISVRVYFPSTQRFTMTRKIPPSPFPRIVPLSQLKYTRSASVSPSASKSTTSSPSDSPSGSGSQITASPPASPSSSGTTVASRFPKRFPRSQRKYTGSPSALSPSLTGQSASAQGGGGLGQSVNNKSGATVENPTFKHYTILTATTPATSSSSESLGRSPITASPSAKARTSKPTTSNPSEKSSYSLSQSTQNSLILRKQHERRSHNKQLRMQPLKRKKTRSGKRKTLRCRTGRRHTPNAPPTIPVLLPLQAHLQAQVNLPPKVPVLLPLQAHLQA